MYIVKITFRWDKSFVGYLGEGYFSQKDGSRYANIVLDKDYAKFYTSEKRAIAAVNSRKKSCRNLAISTCTVVRK